MYSIVRIELYIIFVSFDSLRPSQQFSSHVQTGLHELDQY